MLSSSIFWSFIYTVDQKSEFSLCCNIKSLQQVPQLNESAILTLWSAPITLISRNHAHNLETGFKVNHIREGGIMSLPLRHANAGGFTLHTSSVSTSDLHQRLRADCAA